jgi:hypothetical protein
MDRQAPGQPRASVLLTTRPMWRIRLGRELPRYVLCALSLAGLAASARFAIAPPTAAAPAATRAGAPAQDLAAEAFAQLFARRYLTWEADDPEAHQRALAEFVGPGMESGAGLQPPAAGRQQVQWTEVVQERPSPDRGHVYTVAVQADPAGLIYLAVSVSRASGGELELDGYPAFVGAPASGPAPVQAGLEEVRETELRTVVERALRNYLAGSGAELAADLTNEARVSLPAQGMSLEAMQRLDWSPEGRGALSAVIQAQDGRGARYTLAYALEVTRVAGRWEVAAIEMDPDT